MSKPIFYLFGMLPLIAAAQSAELVAPPSALSASGGRYVFGQISPLRRDQFMLDTQSGRLWRIVCASSSTSGGKADCAEYGLEPISYLPSRSQDQGTPPVLFSDLVKAAPTQTPAPTKPKQ